MANEVLPAPFLHKRGESAKVLAYTGPAGEIVIDLGKKTSAVQDGTTAGGTLLVPETRTITPGTGILIDGASSAVNLSANRTIAISPSGVVSAKTGNALTTASGSGEDGLLYVAPVDVADLIGSSDELLWKDTTDGKIKTGLDLAYNTTTGKFDITNHAGTIIATVTVPSSVSMLQSAELVVVDATHPQTDDSGNPLANGTYMHFVFKLADGTTSNLWVDVTSLIDVYTAGAGIDLTSNKFSVDLTANGGLEFSAVGDAGTLQVDFANLVSSKTGNAITLATGTGEDGKLFVNPGVTVSSDTGNIIQAGTDGGALLKLATANNAAMLDSSNDLIVPLDCGVLS